MKTRKRITLTLVSILLVAMLAACGGNSSPSPTEGGAASSAPAASSAAPAAQSSAPAPSGERVKLQVSIFDRGTTTAEFGTVMENKYVDWLRENFAEPNNIDLEFVAIQRTEEVNQLNTLMASKSAPDVVFTYTDSVYYNYAAQGGLTPLDDSIAAYGQTIVSNFGDEVLRYGQYDGQQLAIYAKRAALDITGHYIRKDWLDKAGFELRTYGDGLYTMTVEELESVLPLFRDNDYDGTGQQIFALGMSGSGDQTRSVRGIVDVFHNKAEITDEIYMCYKDIYWPGHKEGLRWLNTMYNDGMIDPDYGTQKDTTKKAEYITSGRTGYWTDDSWFQANKGLALDALKELNPEAEVVAFRLENVNGEMFQQVYAPTAIILMNPSFSERANEAVMYLNFICGEENDRVLRYGFEGENYTMVDGIPTDINLDYQNLSDYALMYNGDPDVTINNATVVASLSDFVRPIRTATLKIGTEGGYPTYKFGQEIVAETKYNTDLGAKIAELYVNSIMASPGNFDAVYDQYLNEHLSIGGQEVIDEKTALMNSRK